MKFVSNPRSTIHSLKSTPLSLRAEFLFPTTSVSFVCLECSCVHFCLPSLLFPRGSDFSHQGKKEINEIYNSIPYCSLHLWDEGVISQFPELQRARTSYRKAEEEPANTTGDWMSKSDEF